MTANSLGIGGLFSLGDTERYYFVRRVRAGPPDPRELTNAGAVGAGPHSGEGEPTGADSRADRTPRLLAELAGLAEDLRALLEALESVNMPAALQLEIAGWYLGAPHRALCLRTFAGSRLHRWLTKVLTPPPMLEKDLATMKFNNGRLHIEAGFAPNPEDPESPLIGLRPGQYGAAVFTRLILPPTSAGWLEIDLVGSSETIRAVGLVSVVVQQTRNEAFEVRAADYYALRARGTYLTWDLHLYRM
jgi:hypothetical protein